MSDVERKVSSSCAHDRHQCDDHGSRTWNADTDDAFRSPDSPLDEQVRERLCTGIEFTVGQPGIVGIHRDALGVEPESPLKDGGISQHQESFAQGRVNRVAEHRTERAFGNRKISNSERGTGIHCLNQGSGTHIGPMRVYPFHRGLLLHGPSDLHPPRGNIRKNRP